VTVPDPAAPAGLSFRDARPRDAAAIAALHTDSWQRTYRGDYTDRFLDDEAPGFLLDLWTGRLARPDPAARTVVAELDGAVAGLLHTVLDSSAAWGALLDNLHVSYRFKRHGIGSRLMAIAARTVLDERPGSGLFLWVFERNAAARAFYEAKGGSCVEALPAGAPGGDAGRLHGQPVGLRMAWPDPAVLLTKRP
jgi:GNAT superfamily N-acetyltransferase